MSHEDRSAQPEKRPALPRELKLYGELASWWPLLSAPAEYAPEAAFFRGVFEAHAATPPRSLLELGSGGGNTASHLKEWFDVTLVDRSAAMLDVSRNLNPECDHVEGDMRAVRLGRTFDAVLVHDAVAYMTTEQDLRLAMATAWAHCAGGGAALFAPDAVRETFRPITESGGHDGQDRGLRYLAWEWDPDPDDQCYVVDHAYLLREGVETSVAHDRHELGLFARADWMRWLADTGFAVHVLPFDLPGLPRHAELFVGTRPSI